jgi:RNA polymerase sigma factor (sigma-70 family)
LRQREACPLLPCRGSSVYGIPNNPAFRVAGFRPAVDLFIVRANESRRILTEWRHPIEMAKQAGVKGTEMKYQTNSRTIKSCSTAREVAILQGIDLVSRIAKRLRLRVPRCISFDDLFSAGMVGMIQAVDRFDRARGLKFKSYAQHRIGGAMLDFLREADPLSRAERRRVRESDIGATCRRTQPATVSLNEIPVHCLATSVLPTFIVRSEVQEARCCLSAIENRVIALLYDVGWQSREIAADLHLNERRVSQIKRRALAKLRLQLQMRTARTAG